MSQKNVNHKTFWSDAEEEQLLDEFSQKFSVKQIAQAHNRTVKAIEHRLARVAAKEVANGMMMADAASKYHVTESLVDMKLKQIQTKKPKATDRIAELETRVAQAETRVAQAETRVAQLEALVQQLIQQQPATPLPSVGSS